MSRARHEHAQRSPSASLFLKGGSPLAAPTLKDPRMPMELLTTVAIAGLALLLSIAVIAGIVRLMM
jgi:hypothetical protein